MKRRIVFSLFICLFIQEFSISTVLFATELQTSDGTVVSGHELSIAEVLLAAEELSPELKAAAAREAQAHNDIEIGKSYYYPTLDAEAIESYGFAGSNGALGIGGLMGSPFRKGLAGGFVSRLNIFDLSRDFHLKTTHSLLKAAKAQTRIIRYQVDLTALRIYFDCIRYRGQMEAWQNIASQINKIVKEVESLVKTGQHSPVDLLLIQTQAEDAEMNYSASAEQYQIALKRLALITGFNKIDISCPDPAAIEESNLATITLGTVSPFIEHAQAIEQAAKNSAREKSAERFPKLTALASVGTMDGTPHLAEKKDYSAGFAVTLPLFEGFRINNEVSHAKNIAKERKNDLLSARFDLDELNAFYDETIEPSRIKLQFLDHELKIAQQATSLAKERYFSFQGPLVDVREALRTLAGIESKHNDDKVELLFALSAKMFINGGHVELPVASLRKKERTSPFKWFRGFFKK